MPASHKLPTVKAAFSKVHFDHSQRISVFPSHAPLHHDPDALSPVYHYPASSSPKLAGRMHLMAVLTVPQTFHKAWLISL
jgi:hypothetical protein